MKLPGFIAQLRNDIANLSQSFKDKVNIVDGLRADDLLNLLAHPADDRIVAPQVPIDTVTKYYHDDLEAYHEVGVEALQKGEVAYCIIADDIDPVSGAAKSLLRIPGLDMSLITLKMFQSIGTGPVVIVSSENYNEQHKKHLLGQVGIDPERILYLNQYQSYALNPDYSLDTVDGIPSLHSCGPGDIFPLLTKQQLSEQVKYIVVVDVSNVFATLDPAILGHHIVHKHKVSCEVVRRKDDEPGKVLVDSAEGLQITEISRIDVENLNDYSWLCTGSYIINRDLAFSELGKKWYRFKPEVKGKVQVHHKRVIEEITTAYETAYVAVDRAERFMPVRSYDDLNIVQRLVNLNWKS